MTATNLNPVTDRDMALIKRVVDGFREATGIGIGLRIDITENHDEKGQIFGYLQVGDTELKLVIEIKRQPGKAFTGYLYQKFTSHLLEQVGRGNYPRVFKPTGLKVVFALLCRPELVNATYQKIAQIADVPLGTVARIMTDLKEMGYIVELDKDKRGLRKVKKLFDRWVEAYPEQLRPRLVLGRFATPEQDWWKNTKLKQFPAYLGGCRKSPSWTLRHTKGKMRFFLFLRIPVSVVNKTGIRNYGYGIEVR